LRWAIAIVVVTVVLIAAAVPLARLYIWVAVVNGRPPAPIESTDLRTEALESNFATPVELTYADLTRIVNGVLPPAFDQEFPLHLHGFEHEGVTLHAVRGPVALTPADDRIEFTIPVSGTARFHGVLHPGWSHFHVMPGKSISEKMSFSGHVHGALRLRPNADWTVSVDPTISLTLDSAEATILHFGHVSVRGEGQKLFDRVAPEWLKRSSDKALAKLGLRDRAATAWAAMQQPIRASDDPPVWVVVRPTAFRLAPIRFGDPQRLRLGVSLVGSVSCSVSTRRPGTAPVTSLPAAVLNAAVGDHYRMVLPVGASLDALEAQVARALDGRTFSAGGTKVRVSSVTVRASGDRLVMGFDFAARNLRRLRAAKGHVFVSAAVAYDARSGSLGLRDLRYDLDTESQMLALGEWIARPRILATVQNEARTDVAPLLQEARVRANAWLARLSVDPRVRLSLTVDELRLDDVRLTGGRAFLLLRAQGRSSVSVTPS
jgi:hypothetical protein